MTEIKKFIDELEREAKVLSREQNDMGLLERLQDIARTYDGEDKLISSLDIEEKLKNSPPEEKIMSGYPSLDSILGGFRAKQLVVVSAATKSGKTSWCIDLTSHLRLYAPLWLPFEEGAEELVQKFIDRGEKPPLFYAPERMVGNTLTWVEKKVIEAKAKYNSKIIFIDHLHFIVDFGENMSVQIGRTMRELKRIAKTWGVVIFLIAHVKKTKMEEQPSLEDLRDSSFVAQEADTVIMLWRETKKVNGKIEIGTNVNISVQANRRTGKTGNVEMIFSEGKFYEKAWERSELEKEADAW